VRMIWQVNKIKNSLSRKYSAMHPEIADVEVILQDD